MNKWQVSFKNQLIGVGKSMLKKHYEENNFFWSKITELVFLLYEQKIEIKFMLSLRPALKRFFIFSKRRKQ